VAAGAHIEGAIIDKNCRIGPGVRVVNARGLEATEETEFGMIRDHVVVVKKGTTLPPGWTLA
jgi:glucose-1-phosphate adenylyltransferase